MNIKHIAFAGLLVGKVACAADFREDFESGLDHWVPLSAEHAEIVDEPGQENRVLQLTPRSRDFSHVGNL